MTDIIKLVVNNKEEPPEVEKEETKTTNQDAIDLVEKYLKELKSGDISSIGLVAVYTNGSVAVAVPKTENDFHRLVSGAAMLQNSLMNA